MAVGWKERVKVKEVELMPRGGRLPEKAVSKRGKKKSREKNKEIIN
jgi:hypothetical protein